MRLVRRNLEKIVFLEEFDFARVATLAPSEELLSYEEVVSEKPGINVLPL